MGKSLIAFSGGQQDHELKANSPMMRSGGGEDNGKPASATTDARKTENVNFYNQKKTLAQSFLDMALLAANAAQLKRILYAGELHPHYGFLITLISISIGLQIFQAVLMCAIGIFLDLNDETAHNKLIVLNNVLAMSTGMCLGVNVLVSAFDIAESK